MASTGTTSGKSPLDRQLPKQKGALGTVNPGALPGMTQGSDFLSPETAASRGLLGENSRFVNPGATSAQNLLRGDIAGAIDPLNLQGREAPDALKNIGESAGLSPDTINAFKQSAQSSAAGVINAGQSGGKSQDQLEQEIFRQIIQRESEKRQQQAEAEAERARIFAGRQAALEQARDRPGSRQTRLSGSFLTGFGA